LPYRRQNQRRRAEAIDAGSTPSYWGMNYALRFLGAKSVLPVINLPLLAALTPPDHSVTQIDENVEEIDLDRCWRADIVGVTGMNVQRARMQTKFWTN
jgi:hypothetical protein